MKNYSFNPSPRVRSAIYVVTAVANPVVGYLTQSGVVSEFVAGLWMVVNAAIIGLARLNVSPPEEVE